MRIRRLSALSLTLLGLLAGCGQKDVATDGTEVVRIGSVAPLTGAQSHIGKDNDNGARMAVDEINAAGLSLGGKPVKLELISEDDAADPKTATNVAQKLVDEGVKAVIGHLNSGTTIPASKIYHDAGIPQISPSATAIAYTAQGYNTAYRVMANDAQQGKALGQYAVTRLGAKKVAIIDDRTAYGQGLADEFEKAAAAAGAEVVAREYTNDKATDFTAILTSIKGKSPDLVFFGGMDPQGGPMARQMKRLGLPAKLLGGDGLQNINFLKLAGADADGVVASSPGLPLEAMPGGAQFKQKFEAKYGPIQVYAPYAYDAVQVLVAAMKRADSAEPAKVLAELPKTDYAGVTGPLRFDAKGDTAGGAVTLYQVENGAWVVLETVK
ncbi:branched-chain amino acid ABC transporter substrate-binding protein [Parasulfuritortus cantonensis]|uniref:Branched-chain amino acid ABC transporter substrate-binding protein n=1 Tax=Parasulfuritortus cantonensis TaxID=2528202 RepID=A0A4R1B441_9PROT|nr:branched-chain amino acid ABC transporter substrate-binding protein [Parasulfuritortus cantonensis]TCJ12854.1 branched-chain amino acid ABC transporter substrate-binding protein [Parasulfuritortus cantonensis]